MILRLVSYPRSGRGFIKQTLREVYGLPLSFKHGVDGMTSVKAPGQPLGEREIREREADEKLFLCQTHELECPEIRGPVLYLLRDGRDALVSYAWWTLKKERGLSNEEISPECFQTKLHDLIVDEQSSFGIWAQHVERWLTVPQIHVARFERFIQDPIPVLNEASVSLGLTLMAHPGAEVPDFTTLQRENPIKYRRGQVGSWRDEFPQNLLPIFEEKHGTVLRRVVYETDSDSV